MVAVRFVTLPARRVVNLTSPRYDAEIAQHWRGKRDWHDAMYEPVRDLMERVYVDGFNEANGHYTRLEEDILARGIKNPVMLVTGGVQRRQPRELPPEWRGRRDAIVSEYLGGSRLFIAQKHDLEVPAIVNDFGRVFPDATCLRSVEDVAACFEHRPKTVMFSEAEGAYVNDMVYSHMPAGYSLASQIPVRKAIVAKVKREVAAWLAENDR